MLSDSRDFRVDMDGAVLRAVGSDARGYNVPPSDGKFEGQKVGVSRPSAESSPIAVPMPLLDKASMGEILSNIMMAIQPLIVQAVTAAVTSAMEAAMNQLLRSDGLGSLKSQTHKTHFDLDRLEQYGRRESIRIHGVEEKAGENTNEIVVKLAKDI